MKSSIIALCLVIMLAAGCNKDTTDKNCTAATINQTSPFCTAWGVTVNGTTYRAENLPAEYEQEGLGVCVEYEINPGPPIGCACCGSTIKIISISRC